MSYAGATQQTQASLQIRQAEIGTGIEKEGAYAVEEAAREAAILGVKKGAYGRRASVGARYGISLFGGAASGAQLSPDASALVATAGGVAGDQVSSSAVGAALSGAGGTPVSLLKSIADTLALIYADSQNGKGSSGSVGRSVSSAAQAPQN